MLSVPAEFDAAQRTATRLAAQQAGLDVLRLVNEPTAASLAYGIGLAMARTSHDGHSTQNGQALNGHASLNGQASLNGKSLNGQSTQNGQSSATGGGDLQYEGEHTLEEVAMRQSQSMHAHTEADVADALGLHVIVIDLGGGTLDVALLRLYGHMFFTEALAGIEYVHMYIEYVHMYVSEKTHISLDDKKFQRGSKMVSFSYCPLFLCFRNFFRLI